MQLGTLHQKLLNEPSAQARSEVAGEIASGFTGGTYNPNEKKIAVEIFRLLMGDAEIRVRKMLSEQLKGSMEVPRDIMLKLARDIAEVALPVLEHSYVLSEDDLVEITRSTQDVGVMSAIARRETVSIELSQALLQKSNAKVVETLLANKSASIDEGSLNSIYSSYTDSASILELMVKRGGMSVTLAEKLFTAVSDEMKKVLTRDYKLSLQVADTSMKDAREMATLGLVDNQTQTMDIAKLVDQLYQQGRLSLSMIIRSLCLGDMRFFEHAMAKLSDIPVENAQLLILDQGESGFKTLYKTSCLPMELFSATHYLLKVALEETSFGRYQRSDFRQRLASRLKQDDTARKIEYMDYLITLVQNNVRDVASAS